MRHNFNLISPIDFVASVLPDKGNTINRIYLPSVDKRPLTEKDIAWRQIKLKKERHGNAIMLRDSFHKNASKLFKNGKKIALAVPYHRLSQIKSWCADSNVIIDNYESVEDFWTLLHGNLIPRCEYDAIVDLCEDDAFWNEPSLCPLFAPDKRKPKTAGNVRHFDLIINAPVHSAEWQVMRELAAKMWKDSVGEPGFWETPGLRQDKPQCHNPHFVLTSLREYEYYRLPPCGGGEDLDHAEAVAVKIQEVCTYLKQSGCNWFTGEPQISVIDFQQNPETPNQLVLPGTEYLYPLAVDSQQVLKWILDGSVTSKKVVLAKARPDLDINFQDCFDYNPNDYWTPCFEELADSGAECVVWYCNNARSNSPYMCKQYFKWLRLERPESRQRVLMLEKGINGLASHVRKTQPIAVHDAIFKKGRNYF